MEEHYNLNETLKQGKKENQDENSISLLFDKRVNISVDSATFGHYPITYT